MNELIQNLVTLQAIEFDEIKEKAAGTTVAELRAKIPAQILVHYDRLVTHGKKGVAMVREQVCSGCHMRLPIGVIMTLRRGDDIQLCDSCGRYLCLVEPVGTEAAPAVPVAKPKKKTRKSKKSGDAA
jgi:predicted  nucleic acid-binding Zn-ribbon protein